jgi:hypothetical protein
VRVLALVVGLHKQPGTPCWKQPKLLHKQKPTLPGGENQNE